MRAQDFLKSKLTGLINVFPNIQASVFLDRNCDTFFVELMPKNFFEESKELKAFRLGILDEFYETYQDYSLSFITDGSLLEIKEFEYTLNGCDISNSWVNVLSRGYYDSKIFKQIGFDTEPLISAGENNYALAA